VSRRVEVGLVALVLAVQVGIALQYATRIPPYNAPDEPAHANYARHVAATASLPVLRPGDWDAALLERLKAERFPEAADVSTIGYESHQPPLYYLLAAPLAGGGVVAMRLGSVVIGAVALLALYLTARALIADQPTALLALALAALVPQHGATRASVSNDGLTELWLSLLLLLSVVLQRVGTTGRRAGLVGLVTGLAMLTKLSGWVAAPVAVAALLLAPTKAGRKGAHVAVAGAVAAGLVVPWLIRGALVYGLDDPLGLRRHDEVVGGQQLTDAADLPRMAATLFRSFWGQFGWMGVLMDERVYLALGALSAVIATGIVLWLMPWGGLWRESDRRGWSLAGLLLGGVVVATVAYNARYLQPQGRYLFPAMAALAPLAAVGLRELISERQRVPLYVGLALSLVALDLVALWRFILPDLVR
jgi:4-amino-4-deoxy-L-arabinose transferase-like glycosyltransferase